MGNFEYQRAARSFLCLLFDLLASLVFRGLYSGGYFSAQMYGYLVYGTVLAQYAISTFIILRFGRTTQDNS
jgi:hypothetical protein